MINQTHVIEFFALNDVHIWCFSFKEKCLHRLYIVGMVYTSTLTKCNTLAYVHYTLPSIIELIEKENRGNARTLVRSM